MRILFVTDLYKIKDDNTIPSVVEDFSLAFKNRGHSVFILRCNFLLNSLIRKHKIFYRSEYYKNDIKIYNKNFILPFLNDDISYLKEKYDLIISHMPSGNIYASMINKKLKLPHIAIIHQSDYHVLNDIKYSIYFKNRLKKALNLANIVGARNKFLKDKLNASFILPSFVKLENIVSKKNIQNENKLKIITLSKLIKRKNIDLVIKALSRVDFDYSYSIYGDGKLKKYLENLIKKYGLEEKIKIYPHVNHDLIWKKLDENDVFILPSVNETFGLSYLESMSRGLITIGTKNTGIDGVIKNNENGYLINPDIDEIVSILNKIKSSNQEKIIKNTLSSIKKYNEEEIMNKYDEIIKKIL